MYTNIFSYRYLVKFCRLCGEKQNKHIRTHLKNKHQLSMDEIKKLEAGTGFFYREVWGIPFPKHTNWKEVIES